MIEESSVKISVVIPGPRCTGGHHGTVQLTHPVGVDSVCLEISPVLTLNETGATVTLSSAGIEGLRDLLSAYLLTQKELT